MFKFSFNFLISIKMINAWKLQLNEIIFFEIFYLICLLFLDLIKIFCYTLYFPLEITFVKLLGLWNLNSLSMSLHYEVYFRKK